MQEKGSNAVSMQAIARAAGVSVGLLYKYFSDKEQILLAVITRVLGAFRTRVPEAIEGIDDPVVAVVEAVRRAAEAGDLRDVPPEIFAYDLDVAEEDLRTRVVRTEEEAADDTSGLTSARAVVGAGRGVGSENGFGEVLELVDHLGGALGVSRVVTGLGWRPHAEQVGQTGSRISPDVYIACGISGAIQHMAGIEGAKTLVAINTDEEATMVQRADYAIIGDLHEVVGAVNEEIVRRRG